MRVKPDKIINYSIISFGLYPIMPNNLKGVFMIFLFLTSLNYYYLKKRKTNIKPFLINSGLFFFYLISMIYSEDLHHGFKKLGPGISILLFPLVFFIFLGDFKIKRVIIQKFLNTFSISTVLFLLLYFLHLFFVNRPQNPYFDFPTAIFFRNTIIDMPLLGHHPIYISLFIGISLINLTRLSVHYKNKSIILIPIIFIMFIQFLTLFIISSKATILALFIVATFVYYHKYQNKTKTILLSAFFILIIGAVLFLTPQTRNRFKELFKENTYSTQNINENNSSQIRIAIWKTSIDNIKKAPLFGYGIGDVQNVLNNSYKNNYPILLKTQYNSHNQYLGIWLSTGIIGLLFFFYFLYFNFDIGFKNSDFTFTAILLFFCLNFLTENIIDRQAGATLFFFLVNLLGFYNYSYLKNTTPKKRKF